MALGFGPISGNPVSSDTGTTVVSPVLASKVTGYAVVNRPATGVQASKLAGYSLLGLGTTLSDLSASKVVAYAVVNGGDVIVSKLVAYSVVVQPVFVSKLTAYAVLRASRWRIPTVYVNT